MIGTLLLLLKAFKFGKIFTVAGTMLLSMVTYSFFFGWPFAAGFVLLLLVHEMGHFIAARHRGLKVGAPTFIPFVGAWIQMKEQPVDVETEAYVGFAGPFVGTLGALACYYAARYCDSRLLLAVSYSGFFLNLFNLIPISPFDGGRITAILSPRIWLAGVPLMIGLFFWKPSPMLIVMAVLAFPHVMKAFRYDARAPGNMRYYTTSVETKVTYSVYYLALAAFLSVMTYDVHRMLEGV